MMGNYLFLKDSMVASTKPNMTLNMQNILIGLLIVASLAIGYLYGQNKSLQGTNGTAAAPADAGAAAAPEVGDVDKVTKDDHLRGDLSKAKVALIEYSDFECPFCGSFHPTAKQAFEAYGDDIVWVYRNFPLSQIHPNAQKFAEAAECVAQVAGEDAYWKMADKLFEVQSTLTQEKLSGIAVSVGANQAKFDTCLKNGDGAAAVKKGYDSGVKAGITGTPGNIIMNLKTGKVELIAGAVPFETLKTSIDKMMKE